MPGREGCTAAAIKSTSGAGVLTAFVLSLQHVIGKPRGTKELVTDIGNLDVRDSNRIVLCARFKTPVEKVQPAASGSGLDALTVKHIPSET